LVGKPEGKKPFERHGPRKEDNIQTDLTEIGLEGAGWLSLDQDKVAAVVKTVMNLLIP
jgi:hypothetical protein